MEIILYYISNISMSTTVKTTEVVEQNVQPTVTEVQPANVVEENVEQTDDVNKAKDDKEAERANDIGAEVSPSSTITMPTQ